MRKRERGAVLVESALVVPLVMLLIFAVIWGGFVFRTYLTVDHAASTGARSATIAGNEPDADYQILQKIRPDLTALGKSSLQRIIVYPATKFEQPPSAACLASGTGCNTYDSTDFNRPSSAFSVGGAYTKDDKFSSSTRSVTAGTTSFVGIYIEAKPLAGGMGLPAPETLAQFKVLKIEPQTY